MNSCKVKKVKLPASLLAEINALPSNGNQGSQITFTPEMDAVLHHAWPIKRKADILALFKKRYGFGSADKLRERYRKLVKEVR